MLILLRKKKQINYPTCLPYTAWTSDGPLVKTGLNKSLPVHLHVCRVTLLRGGLFSSKSTVFFALLKQSSYF